MKNISKLIHAILLLSFISCHSRTGEPSINSSHVISNDISNQQISSFAEDAFGHVWIGTFRGLNKYNGHEYHQYFNSDDSLSLRDNQVRDLFRDSKGRFWVATVNGISLYTDQDCFRYIPNESESEYAHKIVEDQEGRLFLNMAFELCEYVPEEEKFKVVIPDLMYNDGIVIDFFIDGRNKMWIVNPERLLCVDLETMEVERSFNRESQPTQYAFLRDNGELWLASFNTLTILDTETGEYIDKPGVIQRHPRLSEAVINYIHPYNNQSLLINTQHGLYLYNAAESTVTYQDENNFPFVPPTFNITTMFTDSQNNLWIGSHDQGFVTRYSYMERFNNNHYLSKQMANKSIVSLEKGEDGNLWIVTSLDGVYVFNMASETLRRVETHHFFPENKYLQDEIRSVFVDDDGQVWFTTNFKLIRSTYDEGRNVLLEKKIYWLPGPTLDMNQDRNGTIWAGSGNESIYALRKGVDEFERVVLYPRSFTFTSAVITLSTGEIMTAAFPHNPQIIHPDTWESEEIDVYPQIKRSLFIPICLYEDTRGDIWMGTITNGLLRYVRESNTVERIEGTTCTDISAIQEDKEGDIWVSTLYGLSKYDRATKQFTSYYKEDGIGGNQFNERSSYQLDDGTLMFGATHGLTFFNPLDVTTKRTIPLLFEDLKVHNRLVLPFQSDCIDKSLMFNPDINLRHDQSTFSISFAALDYSEWERIHYHYMMEGFDKYWIDARNNRIANYSNLPAGKYTFRVRITNNDKSIVEAENSIPIRVKPAPWGSWWAYAIYSLVFASILFLLIRLYNGIQHNKRQVMRAKEEKEQEQRLNAMNMTFFANISHEFRTPLTMISGPIAQLYENPAITGEPKRLLRVVQRSVKRMSRLVDQLMDVNKLEHDSLKLKVKRTDVVSELTRLSELFELNAKSKAITFRTHGLEDSFLTWLDVDKFEKITVNLISNALKFTPKGGRIELSFDVISRDEAARLFNLSDKDVSMEYIQVTVADSGPGIPEDKLEKVFERYFQLDNQHVGVYNWGTGIGLYYARRMAELHHGYVRALNRKDDTGTRFTYILPVQDSSYSEEERDAGSDVQEEAYPIRSTEAYNVAKRRNSSKQLPSILVVDDDTEIVHYLKSLLSEHYDVTYRFDADSAYKTLKEHATDLVLTDIVMPGSSGIELCQMIKDDMQLCHIPVVLITAKATVEDQVVGLNTGADAYVTKPFEPNYLLALLKSQLSNREKIRSILGKSTKTERVTENILSPQDNAFMTELYQLMENELSNPELNITRMTEVLRISRTKFYNKVKALTGENPNVFFRTYKLNRAAELLLEGRNNVSEVADMTGFSTLSHFSASFKKRFGQPPSKYRR